MRITDTLVSLSLRADLATVLVVAPRALLPGLVPEIHSIRASEEGLDWGVLM
jgi:hypothetical protein